jgi:GPH family glycoside/pentoside/hexuronide:cation symporter
MKEKIGYKVPKKELNMFALGTMGQGMIYTMMSSYISDYYVNVLQLPLVFILVLMLGARIWDAINDPMMGVFVDKRKPGKNGKFRPWLLRACGPVALASFLMYQSSIAGAPMGLKIFYMFATYLLWGSVCYTAINIPYGSMASVMSTTGGSRTGGNVVFNVNGREFMRAIWEDRNAVIAEHGVSLVTNG